MITGIFVSVNLKPADVHKSICVFGECEKGRVVGPLDRHEFPDVQVSLFGEVSRGVEVLSSPRGRSARMLPGSEKGGSRGGSSQAPAECCQSARQQASESPACPMRAHMLSGY